MEIIQKSAERIYYKSKEYIEGDVVMYSDPQHNIVNGVGFLRENKIVGKWECINKDIQSGGDFGSMENVKPYEK